MAQSKFLNPINVMSNDDLLNKNEDLSDEENNFENKKLSNHIKNVKKHINNEVSSSLQLKSEDSVKLFKELENEIEASN
jgi:hypothetical protein